MTLQDKPPPADWITARYNGICSGCHREVNAGELIRRDDEDAGWVCEGCGQ